MTFDGRDYYQRFEEACVKLVCADNEDEVRSELEQIEWTLWEAIRDVFLFAAVIPSGFLVLMVAQILKDSVFGWWLFVMLLLVFILLTISIYWLLRFLFWYQISRHVKDRKFGR